MFRHNHLVRSFKQSLFQRSIGPNEFFESRFDLPGITIQPILQPQDTLVRLDELMDQLFNGLPVLRDEILEVKPSPNGSNNHLNGVVKTESDEKRASEVLRWKTILSFLNAHWPHGYVSVTPAILKVRDSHLFEWR